MLDYETLRVIWWLLLGVLLIGFAVMDGFDLGVAMLFRILGRDDAERRALLESIEPVWDGNQVWFILGGGAVFAAWPLLYAASFSGLYLAMFLLLLTFITRPVALNFRNKVTDPRWRGFWDWVLTLGGTAAALLFGVAFGNLFLGLPFHIDAMQRPVFTPVFFSLLSPFALLAGLVSLSMLALHGATYAALKSEAPIAPRARRLGEWAAGLYIVTFVASGIWVEQLNGLHITQADPSAPSNPLLKSVVTEPGGWLASFEQHPLLWLVPALGLMTALGAAVALRTRRDGLAFVASGTLVATTILTAGVALFPFLLPSSTHPGDSLTVWDASSSRETLMIMLVAVVIFMPLIVAYTSWVFHVLRGRVSLAEVRRHLGPY